MSMGDTTYTMKQYVFCMYLSGQHRSQSEAERDSIQALHLQHISSMAEHNHLQLVGPLESDGKERGIMIFDLATTAEAEAALARDPAVITGRLEYVCYPWWGAKGSSVR